MIKIKVDYILTEGKVDYFLARSLIFLFTYSGLLCGGYFVIASAYGGLPWISHPASIVIEIFAAIELLWFLCGYLPFRELSQRNTRTDHALLQPEPLNRAERAAFFAKCMSLVPDMEHFIRKWVQNAHLDDVRRDNVKDWLLWGLFDREGDSGEDDEELDQYLGVCEARLGATLRKGRGDSRAIRMSFDPVNMNHRSLFFYYIVWWIDSLAAVALYAMGFRFYRQKRCKFFRHYVEYDTAECTRADLASFTSSERWWTGSRPLELVWLPGAHHGAALITSRYIPTASRIVDRYCVKIEVVPGPQDKETEAGDGRRDSVNSFDTIC
ncbi:hypothetical protein MAPG_04118 [Magnaporthiopsis poae ATCC 64411]|uniref:Uncharacterized protein n=1 Tax=Magnaporthiopsis poae (strain ATCC 64411 / 73-15) TaxID=644358 RepID=A0A0C4DVV5_MAGP6|nr:hypothetical protein MAPG_04118 [Magnaporthiopsis poae ATCC 64411]